MTDHLPLREIASAVLIDTTGRLLLQQRDDVPGILCPGMIGLFGGHREKDETLLQCAVREIYEETGYLVSTDQLEPLVSYDGVDDERGGGVLRAELFLIRDVPADLLVITEGALAAIEFDHIAAVYDGLTPAARLAVDALISRLGDEGLGSGNASARRPHTRWP